MTEKRTTIGKFEFLIKIEEKEINNKGNKLSNDNSSSIKRKYKIFLDKILDNRLNEGDFELLFTNIDELPLNKEDKNIFKSKVEYIKENERTYNFNSLNLLQRLSDILQGNLTLGKNFDEHTNASKNINFGKEKISEFINNPKYTLFISNRHDAFKYASRNKKWSSCHMTKYLLVYKRKDALICFGNNSIIKEIPPNYYASRKPDYRFYIYPIYSKRINEKYRGIMIGIFLTGLYGNYYNEVLRELLQYIYSYLDSRFKILDNLMLYIYNYIFSKFNLDHNTLFPIFRNLFIKHIKEVTHISNSNSEDMTGHCLYYKLPFRIDEDRIIKHVYLYDNDNRGENYENEEIEFI
jgi:hypothetical protein